MKKKHPKYTKWLGDNEYDAAKIDPFYLTPPLLEQRILEQAQCSIPDQIRLKAHEPGVFFSTSDRFRTAEYIGMQQGTEGNILIIGGNGSGKSASIAKPTLLTWKGYLCVTDIKGELSDYYSDLYQEGQVERPYIVFDPTQPDTPSYDPFAWLLQDSNDNLVSNLWEIATAIIPLSPDDKQPFWIETERAIFAAALLYYFNLGLSFSEAICKIMTTSTSSLCTEIVESNNTYANIFLGEAANMKTDVLAAVDRELRNKLMLFASDPYISHAFRGAREDAKCFTWEDLDKFNIFLRIPANRIEQWGGAINLMYTQLIRHLERRPEKYSAEGINSVPILLMLDEFARFGKLEMITTALSTLRSKKVNICLIIQSIAQLDKIYGEFDRRIIFDNCQYQAILRANDADTQKYLCELIGTTEGIQRSISENMDEFRDSTGYSNSITEIRKYRFFPHELATLNHILLISPHGFCQVKKFHIHNSNLTEQIYLPIVTTNSEASVIVGIAEDAISGDADTSVIPGQVIMIPQTPCPNLIMNEGAKMLTIEERIINARNHVDEARKQQRLKQRQDREAQSKKDQRRNYIIGELVTKYFPIVLTFEPGTTAENAVRFKPLETFLSGLATDQEFMKKLTEAAQNIKTETALQENSSSPYSDV